MNGRNCQLRTAVDICHMQLFILRSVVVVYFNSHTCMLKTIHRDKNQMFPTQGNHKWTSGVWYILLNVKSWHFPYICWMVAEILDMFLHIALQEAVLFCSLLQPGLYITYSEEILSILFRHVLTFSTLQAVLVSTRNSTIRQYMEKLAQSRFLLKLAKKSYILKSEISF